jgi:uncharacterized protein YwqG
MNQSQLMQRIRTGPLAAHVERLSALINPTVIIKAEPEKRVPFKCSKFGGNPDLPDSLSWPISRNGQPYTFIAQLNLNEIEDLNSLELPATGILFLFLDLDGADNETDMRFFPLAVLYQADQQETRFPKERPDAPASQQQGTNLVKQVFALFGLTDSAPPPYKPYQECAIGFLPSVSIPSTGSRVLEKLGLSKEEEESYFELWEWMNKYYYSEGGFGSLRGYADPVQGDIMDIECYLESIGEKDFPKKIDDEMETCAAEWKLLLQLDAVDECDMYWGDGLLYVWIQKADLAAREFSRCRGILQYT